MNRRVMRALLVVIGVFAGICDVAGSPSPGSWRKETLLGMNRECYFVWLARQEHPPFYGFYSESVSVQKIRLSDQVVVEDVPLVSISHVFDESTNTWQTTFRDSVAFDLPRYLRTNEILPAFFVNHRDSLYVEDGALFVKKWGFRSQILSAAELAEQVPTLGLDPYILGYSSPRYEGSTPADAVWFVSLQFNESSSDDNWTEVLVLVPTRRMNEANLEMWEKKKARSRDGQ